MNKNAVPAALNEIPSSSSSSSSGAGAGADDNDERRSTPQIPLPYAALHGVVGGEAVEDRIGEFLPGG